MSIIVTFAINHFAIEVNSTVSRKQYIEEKLTKIGLIVKKDTIYNKSENENTC